ncbi:hypothetical protein [Clostridium sp.]|uniref:hypothetical protein n=1 Tax=Clostridium sp. TaxID=1506 RepID=UPI003D6D0A6C
MLEARNFYIIKQADGTLWNFTYKDNFGIIYRIFHKNAWSTYNILVKKASKAFSTIILPDDRICIIYQSSSGNLLLKVYSGDEWKEYSILHKRGNSVNDIQFKTIYALEKIQIFYSILQSHDNVRTLFHQSLTLNNELKVSSPVLIDTTNVNHVNQFVVHALENNNICIMYQKLLNKYELGYKILENSSTTWSKFYNIDKNISPYTDYSLNSVNDKLNILYIKNSGEANALYNFRGDTSNMELKKIAESNNLISCALFREKNITYGFWISNNYLYSYYTKAIDDNISPIKSDALKSMNIFKASFSEISSEGEYISNEIYVQDGSNLTILPNNFFNYIETLKAMQTKLQSKLGGAKVNSNLSLNSMQESPTQVAEEKVVGIENRILKKDQIINQLNYIIKEEKNKVLILSNKISLLEKDYIQWEGQELQLNNDINLLQEALILRESRIHELESAVAEKETKLIEVNMLNSTSEDQNKKNIVMKSEIEEYKISLTNLNKTIEDMNYKISVLEEEKAALINDKANSSLFKKLFNS